MHVVIVESPAKSKTINKYLGSDYLVIASFGHIRDLPSKDGSVRPDEDFAMTYEISDKSTKHVKAISDAVKGAETVYLATDPDREGEAISWHVVEALKARKALKKTTEIKRVVFNEITKRAVLHAIANPRDLDMDLINAQQARRALDYLVGFTLSPVLWRKLPGSKSAGRVQSVALRLICERENEIELFITQEYWDVALHLQNTGSDNFIAQLTHIEGTKLDKFALKTEEETLKVVSQLKTKSYSISKIEKKQSRRNPYPPFTTSSLQQEASRKCGFGASRTMQVAQKLYEGFDIGGDTVGLITYMRTDGVQVAQEAIEGARQLIGQEFGDNYVPKAPRMYKTKAKNAQEAHEAIRPTDVTRTPKQMAQYLDKDQLKLYTLVWNRMIASQMESVVLDQVVATIVSEDKYATCKAIGSTVRFDGFYRLYNEGKDDDDSDDGDKRLPALNEGEDLGLKKVEPAQHFTQPPPRYSEASLVKKMEELGIGRPSTYASIISVLQGREYVRLDKKRFIPEERGRLVTAFLKSFFERYVEYDFTAQLEDRLDEISAGNMFWKDVLRDFWKAFHANIEQAKEYDIPAVLEKVEQLLEHHLFPVTEDGKDPHVCPKCDNGRLSLKLGKFGSFIGCSNYPECRQTKQIGEGTEGEDGASIEASKEPKQLGTDEATGLPVSLRKGPYGWYIQLGEMEKGSKEKPKRSALPKTMNPEDVDLKNAQGLLSLPREIGINPETNKPIKAGIGRFGPYIQHEKTYVSLKGDDDVLTIGINRAVTLLAENPAKKAVEPLRVIGEHPSDKKDVGVYDGRYGPYVKHGRVNASLPKDITVDEITLEKAVELLEAQAAKKKTKKPAKKTTKKTTSKKA